MSQENVEASKRAFDAGNRRDMESFLETLAPEVEWHPGLAALLEGEATVYRGREEVLAVEGEELQLRGGSNRDTPRQSPGGAWRNR
jgi:ketosteroid isomerase-like protein